MTTHALSDDVTLLLDVNIRLGIGARITNDRKLLKCWAPGHGGEGTEETLLDATDCQMLAEAFAGLASLLASEGSAGGQRT